MKKIYKFFYNAIDIKGLISYNSHPQTETPCLKRLRTLRVEESRECLRSLKTKQVRRTSSNEQVYIT